MTRPFAPYDLIRIINLPDRADRRQQMRGELRRIGLGDDPRVGFFKGIRSQTAAPWRRPGERGVFLGHLGILKEAATAGKSVLILEDDADFTPALADTQFPTSGIFYGGYEATTSDDPYVSDIVGAHCMGFSAHVVADLVPYLGDLLDHPDPPPIDGAYVWYRRAHPEVPTVFAVPPIAVQRPSRSDIAELRFFDRVPLLKDAVGVARRLKRALGR
jgi:glycosyl transferase family 25